MRKQEKKVILFIVEGITDKVAFEAILPALNNDDAIKFAITNGDITTKEGVGTSNILERLQGHFKDYMESEHLRKSDFCHIVHLIDTDGAFVNDEKVIEVDGIERVRYYLDRIETPNAYSIQRRNATKSSVLKKLISKPYIFNVAYSVYFFSRNLEHVLHGGIQSFSKQEKMEMAIEFSDRYCEKPSEFLDFITFSDFAVKMGYRESWDFISQNDNSLRRWSNFHICFAEEDKK